ncbi:MAG TPA: 1-deoxy-D-xylulose-5-phosphate reductoisomerase [Candidatus Acidoferrales bacterium]|nr:1-deoxy-D-xylulose-5-phosphate reductoisomerase [Candidatus Acidoferrales bacterium]
MKTIAVLGSTGSIGVNTLDLVERFPDLFRVGGLVAGHNIRRLAAQIRKFAPQWASIRDKENVAALKRLLGRSKTEILWGEEGAVRVATAPDIDLVVAAIVGAAGLVPTLEAVRAKKDVALANKEALVMAGEIFMREAKTHGVRLLPVDSEHSAIFQCLQGSRREEVDRIVLTASGGPFLHTPLARLKDVTIQQALKHPNWRMGPKITVDSATMMNKGLEVVEARWLFDLSPSQTEVLIHPESIVHSMVRYRDGSVIAQLGIPDMRIPIAYALSCPERLHVNLRPLDLSRQRRLTFLPVEKRRYPALELAYRALGVGEGMPAVLNAANEVAVGAFLGKRIGFRAIHHVIARTMADYPGLARDGLEGILGLDRWARKRATEIIDRIRS